MQEWGAEGAWKSDLGRGPARKRRHSIFACCAGRYRLWISPSGKNIRSPRDLLGTEYKPRTTHSCGSYRFAPRPEFPAILLPYNQSFIPATRLLPALTFFSRLNSGLCIYTRKGKKAPFNGGKYTEKNSQQTNVVFITRVEVFIIFILRILCHTFCKDNHVRILYFFLYWQYLSKAFSNS